MHLRRARANSLFAVMVATLLLATSGCTIVEALDNRAPAWWELAPSPTLDSNATTLSVLVSRRGCNDGVTGTVNDPEMTFTDTDIVITFTVSPGEPSSATCPGNDQVDHEISLPEPVGGRQLRDGACASEDARGTIFCDTDVRG